MADVDKPWEHLRSRPGDNWSRPKAVRQEQAHLMVQVMESWLVCDPETLAEFYGQGFRRRALPRNPQIEDAPKADIQRGLENATRDCETKGAYHKGRHSFALLARIDVDNVCALAPSVVRLRDVLTDLDE